MNPLSLLLLTLGFVIEVMGVGYAVVYSGDGVVNMPVLIGSLVCGSLLTVGGVFWHILLRRR